MSSDLKHDVIQSVNSALSNPEAVKTVTLIGGASNFFLWMADHANLMVAISTLLVTWGMFYLNRKKAKQEDKQRQLEMETERLQQEKLRQEIEALRNGKE